jgi:ribosome-associated heat shock protein Hsp15
LDRQRIDKWLWHARAVRTRVAAAALATAGHVRVNGERVDAASRSVRLGDVVTVALDGGVRILRVVGFAERRGPAASTAGLCEDLTPPAVHAAHAGRAGADGPAAIARPAGAGRPTKRDRRAMARFTNEDED